MAEEAKVLLLVSESSVWACTVTCFYPPVFIAFPQYARGELYRAVIGHKVGLTRKKSQSECKTRERSEYG